MCPMPHYTAASFLMHVTGFHAESAASITRRMRSDSLAALRQAAQAAQVAAVAVVAVGPRLPPPQHPLLLIRLHLLQRPPHLPQVQLQIVIIQICSVRTCVQNNIVVCLVTSFFWSCQQLSQLSIFLKNQWGLLLRVDSCLGFRWPQCCVCCCRCVLSCTRRKCRSKVQTLLSHASDYCDFHHTLLGILEEKPENRLCKFTHLAKDLDLRLIT